MVAAQYILLAGEKIAGVCLEKPVKNLGLDEWNRWAERLGEISKEESNNSELASAVEEAHKYMISRASRESESVT
jgi:pyrroloquinoline quinone (PQQ) biosynthesis protein C